MRHFGLIGKSLAHSFSPAYFLEKFEAEGVTDARYEAFELPHIDALGPLLKTPGLVGLNVTIPYKTAALAFTDKLSQNAEAIGAINTLHILNGEVWGHNTDVIGFRSCLKPLLRPHHERALVLGSGGASAAVIFALKTLGLQVVVVSRTPNGPDQVGYSDLRKEAMQHFNLVVNTTPLGQHPNVHEAPAIPYDGLSKSHLLVDLIYNPSPSSFLQRGAQYGASCIDGMHMLKAQANASWRIWNGLD